MKESLSDTKQHILFYNVENLFDIKDDPETLDNEYLPSSAKKWNNSRYFTKITHLSRVIGSISRDLPVIVGLTEIENDAVLIDLIRNNRLKHGNYHFVHFDSKDERGMDVGLLYRQDYFTPLFSQPISLKFPFDEEDTTRDILYVKGIYAGRYTFHIFVNHWPSRREGVKKSESRRIHAAKTIKQVINGIFFDDPQARILVMGDFNDPPESYSMKKVLVAEPLHRSDTAYLINLAYPLFYKRLGTINYRGRWLLFDQIIVSRSFIKLDSGVYISPHSFRIFKPDWLMFHHPKFHEKMPNKTYSGNEYHGGYSDHLPVYVTIGI